MYVWIKKCKGECVLVGGNVLDLRTYEYALYSKGLKMTEKYLKNQENEKIKN